MTITFPIPERAHSINGVEGRMYALNLPPAQPMKIQGRVAGWPPNVFANQTWRTSRNVKIDGDACTVIVDLRFDDSCRNGYMNFSITGEVRSKKMGYSSGGCIHDEISRVFPELAPLIKWHLMGTKGAMHYLANTIYHASDRADSRYAVGEPCAWEEFMLVGNSPIPVVVKDKFKAWLKYAMSFNTQVPKSNPGYVQFEVVPIEYVLKSGETYKFEPHWTFKGFGETWYDCPFSTRQEAEAFSQAMQINNANNGFVRFEKRVTGYAKGKKRELDHARSCAVWPEATDEQLCLPPDELKALLEARAPALVAAFRKDMTEACGFLWEVPEELQRKPVET